jgi:hypothetical protein
MIQFGKKKKQNKKNAMILPRVIFMLSIPTLAKSG